MGPSRLRPDAPRGVGVRGGPDVLPRAKITPRPPSATGKAPCVAVLAILLAQSFPGRGGRIASAITAAVGVAFRPQTVLFWPALAIPLVIEAGRPAWSPGRVARAAFEWFAIVLVVTILAFAPLALAGVLDDFLRGLRVLKPGGEYYRLTPATFAMAWLRRLETRDVIVLGSILLLLPRATPPARRLAWTWVIAWASVSLYKPLSPNVHYYLNHPLALVSAVDLGVLIALIAEAPIASATFRLVAILAATGLGVTAKPPFADPTMTVQVVPRPPPSPCDG